MVSDFMGRIKHMPKRFTRQVYLNSIVSESMINIIRNPDTAGQGLTTLSDHFGYKLTFYNTQALQLVTSIMRDLFTK